MQNPAEADILLKANKISNSIRKKLSEIGGAWLIDLKDNDLSNLCHYFSLYCANELMKGHFLTLNELRNVAFETQAKYFDNEYDKLNTKVHAQIKEKTEVIECYNSILKNLNCFLVISEHVKLMRTEQDLLKTCADALTAARNSYSKLYDELYINSLTSIEKHPESMKLHHELLRHLNYKICEYIESASPNILTEEQVRRYIPDFNTSVLVLMRDKPNYILQETDSQYFLENIAHPNSHYISITFCAYNNKPALFIIDSNLGIAVFKNTFEFTQGLSFILSCYFKFYTQPNIVLQRFKNSNIVPKKIMKCIDWQAVFGLSISDKALPTASLCQQINMPDWAKNISLFLSQYENEQDIWKKVQIIISLEKLLHDEKVLAEINSYAMTSKIIKDKVAHLQEQLKYFFGAPKFLAIDKEIESLKISDVPAGKLSL